LGSKVRRTNATKPRRGAEYLLPGEKHQHRQEQCQDGCCHTRAEEHGVGVILEEKLLATQKIVVLKLAVL